MIHQQRTPLQRLLSKVTIALLFAYLLAAYVSAKPISNGKNPDAQQLSSNKALAPKSTENKRHIDTAAAPAPLSPEHEEVRGRWNKAKKLQRQVKPRRYVRNVPRYEREVVDNVTVPKYILELYKNLTEKSATGILQQTTQANTIRSLQTVNDDPSKCGLFNFSLSSINSSEYIVKADLRFSLIPQASTRSDVVVTIKSAGSEPDSESLILRNDILVENNNQHKYEFDVAGSLSNWLRSGAKYAEFQVQLFADFTATTPLGCNEIHFVHLTGNEETEPLLVVHSYDSEVEKIDYKTILDRINRTEVAQRKRRAIAGDNNDRRVARQTTEQPKIPYCDVISLNITREEIPKDDNEIVILPSLYNAGICGGNCGNTLPVEQNLRHNVLIHMLQGSDAFRNRHGYQITRCCAPIKYAPLEAIIHPAPTDVRRSAYIRIIPNMKIVQCECLEIVDFSSRTK